MWLVPFFVLSALGLFARPPAPQGALQDLPPASAREGRGKVAWFGGSFEELLAEAARAKRLVFLDFYSRSNTYSKKLEKVTYCDPRVVTELSEMLCFSVDVDSKDTKVLRRRFQVLSAPALVFLDADAALREQLSGYLGPDLFLMELRRIKANTGTFSDLRTRITQQPDDLDARWKLACKLRTVGDLAGYEAQISELRERDPEGRSNASRRLRLANLHAVAAANLELEPLYTFVESEKEPAILFEGWLSIWELEGQAARSVHEPERARMHVLRTFAAARALWPLVPAEQVGHLGNNIAWNFYEGRAGASRSDLEFALEVATKAAAAAQDVPAVVDTLACCLFAVGRKEEALKQVRRCIELDPQNPEWRERETEFQRAR
jgi:tetratricopeptide (TPR) repeat protein